MVILPLSSFALILIEYYNNHRYHEALNNLTPADVYYGRGRDILTKRESIKKIQLFSG